MTRSVGCRVHSWRWPVIWWARRKPRSCFRQRVWDAVDYVDWQLVVRRRIRRSLKVTRFIVVPDGTRDKVIP